MGKRRIQITKFDMKRLQDLLLRAEQSEYHGSISLENLAKEMKRAIQVAPREIPPDVITMNSKARLVDCDTGEELERTLVFPEDADMDNGRISVLAPIGTAMLGYRVGDVFEWDVPAGKRRFRVKGIIYQPEAAGHFAA
jgi:regulator of nucleoside diphosphate kinase